MADRKDRQVASSGQPLGDLPAGGRLLREFRRADRSYQDDEGRFRVRWVPHRVVKGIACDTAVSSYRDDVVDLLRLWKSEAVESFDFQAFNVGDYYKAVDEKVISENT